MYNSILIYRFSSEIFKIRSTIFTFMMKNKWKLGTFFKPMKILDSSIKKSLIIILQYFLFENGCRYWGWPNINEQWRQNREIPPFIIDQYISSLLIDQIFLFLFLYMTIDWTPMEETLNLQKAKTQLSRALHTTIDYKI